MDEIWWARPKEFLRTICDLLATNDNIQRLTVRLPYFCSLRHASDVPKAEAILLDLLAPLRRLRVAHNVRFRCCPTNNSRTTDKRKTSRQARRTHSCKKSRKEGLIKTLQAKLGQLDGEKLTYREETWKSIKAMGGTEPDDWSEASMEIDLLLDDLHSCLKSRIFDDVAKSNSDDDTFQGTEDAESSQNPDDVKYPMAWTKANWQSLRTFDRIADEAAAMLRNYWNGYG